MKQSPGVARSSRRLLPTLLPLTILLAVVLSGSALADDQIEDAVTGAGKAWYGKFCTPCHGPGGAPGNAVFRASKQPVDLRNYVERHGGKFPAADWIAVIQDTRPASVHTRVWARIKDAQVGTAGSDAAARGVVASIARYVMSIQTK